MVLKFDTFQKITKFPKGLIPFLDPETLILEMPQFTKHMNLLGPSWA